MKRLFATAIFLLALVPAAQARQHHAHRHHHAASVGEQGYRLSGTATYYGGSDHLCGRRMANGHPFNCGALTVAHRTLPFGTVLRVCSGGNCANATVTDRGPFTGAFLDMSPALARQLGGLNTHHGVTSTVVSMGDGATTRTRGRAVQVAAQPSFFGQSDDVMRPFSLFAPFGETRAKAPVHHRHHGRHHR